jgi:hypothetical protein
MHKNQHTFQRITHALNRIFNEIEKSIFNGHYYLGIFFDVQGAFDNMTQRAIEAGMIKHGFPLNMINLYCN